LLYNHNKFPFLFSGDSCYFNADNAGNKLKEADSVLLVVAGLMINLKPAISLQIDCELIFISFLPPLLYRASWAIL